MAITKKNTAETVAEIDTAAPVIEQAKTEPAPDEGRAEVLEDPEVVLEDVVPGTWNGEAVGHAEDGSLVTETGVPVSEDELDPPAEDAKPSGIRIISAAERRSQRENALNAEFTSEDEARVRPGHSAVKFLGPMRTYNFHGQKFVRDTAQVVADKHVQGLLATGFFRLVGAAAIDQQVEEKRERSRQQKYPVGRFQTKEAAIDYAFRVHGERLDANRSLRQLNSRTLELSRRISEDEVTPGTT